jgi:hypothetical protein
VGFGGRLASVDSKQLRGYGRRVRIDSRTEFVIAVDIARRLGISSQRVNVLANGPGFPKPLGRLGRSTSATTRFSAACAVPTTAEVSWELPEGPFTYFRGRTTELTPIS